MADQMAEENLTFRAFGEDVSAGRLFDKLDDKSDKARRSIKGLDGEISNTEKHLKALVEQFGETGDTSLFRDIRKDRSTLSLLQSMRKEVEGIETAGSGFLGDMQAAPVFIGAAVVAAAAVAPAIGAVIGGAVLGGVGLGGVVGGIALAAQDARVAAAGQRLGREFFGAVSDAARPAIGPTLDALARLELTAKSATATLASGFADLAPLIKPLSEGIDGLVRNLGPGLEKAFKAAEPAVRAIADELPAIGSALGDFFSSISDESDGATEGLISLFHLLEETITTLGDAIAFLSGWFDVFVRTGDEVTAWGEKVTGALEGVAKWLGPIAIGIDALNGYFGGLHDETQDVISGLDRAKDSTRDYSGTLLNYSHSADEAAQETKKFNDAINDLINTTLGLDEAQIRFNKGLIDLKKELKDGAKTLSIHTEEGLKNREAIVSQIKTIEQLRQAHIDAGMPIDRANQLFEQQLRDVEKLAIKIGFNADEVRGLTGALHNLPAKVTTPVSTPGLTASMDQAANLRRELDRLDGKQVKAYVMTVFGEYRAGERNPSGRASGGPVMAGSTYMVGENGPELVTFGANGYVHNTADTKAMLSGASGGSLDVNVSVNPSGGADEFKSMVLKWLRVDAGFRDAVRSYVGAGS